jgi:hypothetical protein
MHFKVPVSNPSPASQIVFCKTRGDGPTYVLVAPVDSVGLTFIVKLKVVFLIETGLVITIVLFAS